MKKIICYLALLIIYPAYAQIEIRVVNYNKLPKPFNHILDDATDVSFAYGLRVLYSDYDGPLIQLRRDSDNATQDFKWGGNDKINVDEITTWAAGATLYVTTWYDQSGSGRHAVQSNLTLQPIFYPVIGGIPYVVGDGINDILLVSGTNNTMLRLTNKGMASLFMVANAASNSVTSFAFGYEGGTSRWSAHLPHKSNSTFFDAGGASYDRVGYDAGITGDVDNWKQYYFHKGNTKMLIRANGAQRIIGNKIRRFTKTNAGFGILGSANTSYNSSEALFNEIVLFNNPTSSDSLSNKQLELEENSGLFWGL